MPNSVPYEDLDPGIREVVRLLNTLGFHTSDSGDGVTKLQGDDPMECAMDFPHVYCMCPPENLVSECDRLRDALQEKGIEVMVQQETEHAVAIQGFYDPVGEPKHAAGFMLTGLTSDMVASL